MQFNWFSNEHEVVLVWWIIRKGIYMSNVPRCLENIIYGFIPMCQTKLFTFNNNVINLVNSSQNTEMIFLDGIFTKWYQLWWNYVIIMPQQNSINLPQLYISPL